MTRKDLCWPGALLLTLAAGVWLWGENRELADRLAARENARSSLDIREAGRADRSTATSPQRGQDRTGDRRSTPSRVEPKPTFVPTRQVSTRGTDLERLAPKADREEETDVTKPGEAGNGGVRSAETATEEVIAGVLHDDVNESLLRNSAFNEELTPWTCKNGEFYTDPVSKNSLVQGTLDDGFTLSQAFLPNTTKRELDLRIRFKTPDEEVTDADLEVGLSGRPQYVSRVQLKHGWNSVHVKVMLPANVNPRQPLTLRIDTKGKGTIWMDDVVLMEASTREMK